jgi:hypothetical protein
MMIIKKNGGSIILYIKINILNKTNSQILCKKLTCQQLKSGENTIMYFSSSDK